MTLQFPPWLLACSGFLFLPVPVLVICGFPEMHPFLLDCLIYWCIYWHNTFLKGCPLSPLLFNIELEITQTQKLTFHLKELEKKQQIDPTPTRRRELIKIQVELNEIKTRRVVEHINKTRSWFFEGISKIDKPLASLIKNKREKTEINKS